MCCVVFMIIEVERLIGYSKIDREGAGSIKKMKHSWKSDLIKYL